MQQRPKVLLQRLHLLADVGKVILPIFPAEIVDAIPQVIADKAIVEAVTNLGQPLGMYEAIGALAGEVFVSGDTG